MQRRPFASLATFALVLLGAAQAGAAARSCLGASSAELDAQQVAAVRAAIEAACPCEPAGAGASRKEFLRCAKDVARAAVDAGELSASCRGAVKKIYARSVCGLPEGKVPCVKKLVRSGKASCSLLEEAACQPREGKYSRVACGAALTCVDAADTSADLRITAADGGFCANVPEDEEQPSSGTLSLESPDPKAPQPTDTDVLYSLSGAELAPEYVSVLANGLLVPEDRLEIGPQSIRVLAPLAEGRNHFLVYAADTADGLLFHEAVIWAGDHPLTVEVLDPGGAPAAEAELTLRLGDDRSVSASAATVGGMAQFPHLPGRTFLIEASSPSGGFGSAGAAPTDSSSVSLQLLGLLPPSPVANNDFSLGTDGWSVGGAPVAIAPHDEDGSLLLPRGSLDDDLTLTTEGEGPVSISRSFVADEETRSIKVRYRFVTSEIPCGCFGTQFNDYFSVTIRAGSRTVSETNSMNGMGRGAFDDNGNTEWRQATLAPISPGDTIQVDLSVANVADDHWQSAVIVDFVEEGPVAITALDLRDLDDRTLTHFAGSLHLATIFGGVTPIRGTIALSGPEGEILEDLELRVLQGGDTVATATLAEAAEPQLIVPFPASEEIRIDAPVRLFDLVAFGIDTAQDGDLGLQAVAKLAGGTEATFEGPSALPILAFFSGNRYGTDRDPDEGGDAWAKPSVKQVAEHFGLHYNDFSNMHGGGFPPHLSHQTGNDVDLRFAGYAARNAATAAALIAQLNDPTYGSRFQAIFVTFERTASNAFWQAIRNVTLNDGRLARNVILPEPLHADHAHWRISD
jgi:hypothetical protein